MRRELVFTFNDFNEALTFMEVVTSRIKSKELLIRYDVGNGVRVRISLQGEPHEVELYSTDIRRIYNDIKVMRGRFGVKAYDMSIILSKAKLKAAMPIDIVIDILRIMGVDAELEGSKIRVRNSIDLDGIIKIIEDVSELYKEMLDMEISAQAKRAIAVYSYVTRKSIRDGINDLLQHGLLRRYGSTDLLVLSVKYEDALSRIRELIKN